ncbi:hypothetical protein MSPP1_002060 [Malassezia sp. CBS 17886]|nr:hypothetical protein MSPP1_002060 [Malassezia sp. CBS 17886]
MSIHTRERVFAAFVSDISEGGMLEVPLVTDMDPPMNALVANVHGKFFATTAQCTHYGVSLTKGVMTGDGRVYCPFHGACYRVTTGDIEDAPALDPLKRIDVQIEDGMVYLLVDYEALNEPTDPVCSTQPSAMTRPHTVFVGGGAVALQAVQEMRRLGHRGRITLVSAEPYPTIDRPKLSKGKAPKVEDVIIRSVEYWRDRLGVELLLSCQAYAVDTKTKRVMVCEGNALPYDHLVLATGSTPFRLPIEGGKANGVYLLRSLEDAQAITAAIERRGAQHMVIIGTGFIGLEMGVALARRAKVTLIGQTHVPLEGPLGRNVGYGLQTALVNERPVRFLNAVDVVRIETDKNNNAIAVIVQPRTKGSPELSLRADIVLMSTGARPATQFLRNSPNFPDLRPDGSVEVDSALRVVGASEVFAGGDIATYPTENGVTRIEHWNVASNHGRDIGRQIATGRPRVFRHIPVFWSGLGTTLRYVGNGAGFDTVHVVGEPDEEEFVAFYGKNNRVIAVATMRSDPVMVQSLALMHAGIMPRLSEIAKGLDIMSLSTAESRPTKALTLNAAERQTFASLYSLADPSQSGIVTGDAAVKFFEGFKLPTVVLGQIWSIADSGNNGFLTPNSFGIALRLIARAQRGESVNEADAHTAGAPPTYEGVAVPGSGEGAGQIKLEDKARFSRIFAMVGPTNGLLSSEQAKDVFVKSKLPFVKLGTIWNLADTKARGALDLTDFIIGMHYIQGTMNGTIPTLPTTLPPEVYEQAAGGVLPAASPLQPQRTGTDPIAAAFAPPTPALRNAPSRSSSLAVMPGTPAAAATPGAVPGQGPPGPVPGGAAAAAPDGWGVPPFERPKYEGFFQSLDAEKTGKVEGAAVVPFFLQSGLDEAALAHVWDLADITQDGTLTRDEFAVAMHLINEKIAGRPLPEQLPADLVPSSLRAQPLPQSVDVKRACIDARILTAETETQRELFSLIDTDVPAMSPSVAATAFPGASVPAAHGAEPPARQTSLPAPTRGAGDGAAAGLPALASAAPGTGFHAPPTHETPFPAPAPTVAPARQFTAPPLRSAAPASDAAAPAPSFSGTRTPFNAFDDDFDGPMPAAAPTADAGARTGAPTGALTGTAPDHSGQQQALDAATKELDETRTQRADTEAKHTQNETSHAELDAQLSRARREAQTEREAVQELELRVEGQTRELEILRQDVIREESELSALRSQKDELEQKILQDRESVRETKRQLSELVSQTSQMREEKERLSNEDRQQTGLAAIAKKQLASAQEDHAAAQGAARDASPSHDGAVSPLSPTTPSARRTNPFDMFAASFAPAVPAQPEAARNAAAVGMPPAQPPQRADAPVPAAGGRGGVGEQPAPPMDASRTQQDAVRTLGSPPPYAGTSDTLPTHARDSARDAVPASDSSDEEYAGPEDAEAAQLESEKYEGGLGYDRAAHAPSWNESALHRSSADAYAGERERVSQDDSRDDMVTVENTYEDAVEARDVQDAPGVSLPGGFPGSSDVPTSVSGAGARSRPPAAAPGGGGFVAGRGAVAVQDGGSAARDSGMGPTPPAAGVNALPNPAVPASGATDAPSSTRAALPGAPPAARAASGAGAAAPSSLDDFDAAFSNLAPAHVVHGSTPSLPPSGTFSGADFASFTQRTQGGGAGATAPALPTRAVPAQPKPGSVAAPIPNALSYLESTTMAPRAVRSSADAHNQPTEPSRAYAFDDAFDPTGSSGGLKPGGVAPSPRQTPADGARAATAASPAPGVGTAAAAGGAPPAGNSRAATPPVPGDAGPVRQLCQMGFSRSQVIRALERCNYRTERALEHLLSNSGRA